MTSVRRVRSSLVAALAVTTACSWGPLHDEPAPPPPPPVDETAPDLVVRPAGGTFAAVQFVTLAADEEATIRYTLDGSDPAAEGPATLVAPSPVFWIRMGPGTTVLKAVAVDGAGNASATCVETYEVLASAPDPTPPSLTLVSAPAAPLPLLASASVEFTSDVAIAYLVEAGGGGVRGWGGRIASGTAAAGVPVVATFDAIQLAGEAPPAVWIHAADAAGLESSLEVPLALAAPVVGPAVGRGNGCADLALGADGRRAYVTAGASVEVVAIDPASATTPAIEAYERLAEPVWLGDVGAVDLAVASDGAHVWVAAQGGVTVAGGVFAFATADGSVTAVTTVAPASSVTVTRDGTRAYWFDGGVQFANADPASAAFGTPLGSVPAVYQPGAVAAATGRVVSGADVIDVAAGSATRDRRLGTLPLWSQYAASPPVPSPDGARVYLASCLEGCTLEAFDVATRVAVARGPLTPPYEWAYGTRWLVAAAPDGDVVLAARRSGAAVRVHRASDLAVLGEVPLAVPPGWGLLALEVAPDGTRGYALVSTGVLGDEGCRLARIPLR